MILDKNVLKKGRTTFELLFEYIWGWEKQQQDRCEDSKLDVRRWKYQLKSNTADKNFTCTFCTISINTSYSVYVKVDVLVFRLHAIQWHDFQAPTPLEVVQLVDKDPLEKVTGLHLQAKYDVFYSFRPTAFPSLET